MVSNLTSVFRSRNNNNQTEKKSKKLSSSSEEQPAAAAMVLVPTVTIQEAPKEIEIAPSPAEPSNGPSSSSVVQEIPVVSAPEEELLKPAESQVEENCTVCSKIEEFVGPIVENVKVKAESAMNRLRDPALHASIRSEVLEYVPSVVVALGVFFFCITLVSVLKLLRHGPQSDPSFFCKYFAGPFSPLFDALCAPEPYVFAEELPRVIDGLLDEILITISELFRTISQGFSVFGTLFTAISNGLSRNVFFGFHELGENLGENIEHLIHFVVQSFHQILHFFLSSIATLAGTIAGVFTAVHDYLEPPVEVVW